MKETDLNTFYELGTAFGYWSEETSELPWRTCYLSVSGTPVRTTASLDTAFSPATLNNYWNGAVVFLSTLLESEGSAEVTPPTPSDK